MPDQWQGGSSILFDDEEMSSPLSPMPPGEPSACDPSEYWGWSILPDGLMWRSYMAAPHEPRISSLFFTNADKDLLWDVTLGGRVGLLRYGTLGAFWPQGWQWDMEGAVMTRLDNRHSQDVTSMDYRFGTQITRAVGPWSAKFGYFHISSHLGDEYIERNPTFPRINYVTESLIWGISHQTRPSLRLYGETAYAFHRAGGAKPLQFQVGAEYAPPIQRPSAGGPFAATNLDIREAVDFDPALSLQTGWQWHNDQSGRRFRLGLNYYNGYDTQFQFFRQSTETLGFGTWFDY